MASYLPIVDVKDCSGLQAPDGKVAKNAVEKAAKFLRALLTNNEERISLLVQHGLLQDGNTTSLTKQLRENIGKKPSLFWVLVRDISQFDDGAEAVKRLQEYCPPTALKVPVILGDLQQKLNVLKDMNPEDELIKPLIIEAIAKELKSSARIEYITDELTRMHQEELVSSELLAWAISETEKEHKQMLETSNVDFDTLLKQSPPAKLCDDDLYYASLCSNVVNKSSNAEQCVELLQGLSYESLSVSLSEDNLAFPTCMIAVSSDSSNTATCYVAFQNISSFKDRELLSNGQMPTFGKVFESKIEKFPTLYLEAIIKRKERLVLTGFSFGGVLAQMLAAHLWLLPHTHTDQLMSNVICITFGQPLIQSDLLTHVAESFPAFKQNVHAIGLEDDSFPSIMEKLDHLTFTKEVKLATVLENLLHLQEFYNSQKRSHLAEMASSTTNLQQGNNTSNVCNSSQTDDSSLTTVQDSHSSMLTEVATRSPAEKELEKMLRSQHADPDAVENFAARRHLIICDEFALNLIEVNEKVEEGLKFNRMADLICEESFDRHSDCRYYNSVKKLAYDQKLPDFNAIEISSDFLHPNIEQVKIILYGRDAIIVITGQKLWFVHSIKMATVVSEPFQAQEVSVSFKASMDDLMTHDDRWKDDKVTIFSHFSRPVTTKFCVEPNANKLSPRGKQLASLEPARLLELAFLMALLEKSPNRFNCSPPVHAGELSPFFNYFKLFLHEIVSVVPYESILCTVACCHSKRTAELCTRMIQKLQVEFQFSLTMYASLFVTAFKYQLLQNMSTEASMAKYLEQQPFEDCAYFMWLKAKYMKGASTKYAVDSFSEEIFTDPYIFGSHDILCEDVLYLQKIVQLSLTQVNSLSEVNAVSSKSATDLYKWSKVDTSSKSKLEVKSLKSPISVLVEGREVLHKNNSLSSLHLPKEMLSKSRSYEETMEVLYDARGGQFDLCIGVLCGFMYQHVRVPFTEVNPMTFWKSLRHHIAPYSDVFKNNSDFWISILKRCQRAITKGSQVVERTYDAKLKFLVTNIDPETKAHTTPTSSEYSMYTLEEMLKDLCSGRGIVKETPIDRIAYSWKTLFENSPMVDVAPTHRTLIGQWIKWSLMIHELRLTLEKHITIAIPGLVNSGKTQLIRSLFGLDVKAGTTELRRTIVPFMYSLAPDVKYVHVIDLPGADDSDKNVSQLTKFLRFISQILVFVVSYDKAHTKDAKKWLDTFEKKRNVCNDLSKVTDDFSVISDQHFESNRTVNDDSSVPVLVCMTFADRLLAEMLDEDGKYDEGQTRKDISKHFEDISATYYNQGMWKPQGKRTLGYYCFNLNQSQLKERDVKAVGIGVPSDVGGWICKQIREEIHEDDIADKLEEYFKRSCRKIELK